MTVNVQYIQSSKRGGGFTFVEILFALFILGLGFIMIAALLPAAISQTERSRDDAEVSMTARHAIAHLEDNASSSLFPVTQNEFRPFTDAMMKRYASALVRETGPERGVNPEGLTRYAACALYRRVGSSVGASDTEPWAEIILIIAKNVAGSEYTTDYLWQPAPPSGTPALQARETTFESITGRTTSPAVITFSTMSEFGNAIHPALAEGAYVVTEGGTIYQLGVQTGNTTFRLVPGLDTTSNVSPASPATCFILGKRLADPLVAYDAATNLYSEPVQDVGVVRFRVSLVQP